MLNKKVGLVCFGFLCCFIFFCCAGLEEIDKAILAYKGLPENTLLQRLGPPNKFYEANGIKYLTYSSSKQMRIPGSTSAYQTTIIGDKVQTNPIGGSTSVNINCRYKVNFSIQNGYIKTVTYDGNRCGLAVLVP